MLSLVIFVVSIACGILGITFIVQGVRQKMDEYEIVPISDFNEMQEFEKTDQPKVEIAQQAFEEEADEPPAPKMDEKNTEDKQKELEKLISDLEVKMKVQEDGFNERITALQKENAGLKEALEKEISGNAQAESSEDLTRQLEESREAVNDFEQRLKEQEDESAQQITELQNKNKELADRLADAIKKSEEGISQEEFNNELQKFRQALLETRIIGDNLKEENARLIAENINLNDKLHNIEKQQDDLEEKEELQKQWETQLAQLRNDNIKLQTQLDEAAVLKDQIGGLREKEKEYQEKIGQLTERVEELAKGENNEADSKLKVEMQDLRLSMRRLEEERDQLIETLAETKKGFYDKLDQANGMIHALKTKLESGQEHATSAQEKRSAFPMVDLKNENARLLKDKAELKENCNRLEKLNNRIAEKERILEYELTKSQAQSLGLEKICEDFKGEIERLSSRALSK